MYILGKYVLYIWFKLNTQQRFVESQFRPHHICLLPKDNFHTDVQKNV